MFQFGDWLDPDAPPRPAGERQDGRRHRGERVPLPLGGRRRPRGGAARQGRRRASSTRAIAEEVRAAFLAEYVTPAGRMISDAQTAYAMAIVFDIAPADQQHGARRAARRAHAPVGVPHRHRIRRHADHPGRAHPHRAPRHRAPPAHADREPVLAVPGDDGRDDDLGALGLDAAGRLDQPGRDDVVQPLRARRDRRLAAPRRGRSRARRARLRAAPHRSRTRSPSSTTRGPSTSRPTARRAPAGRARTA